MMQTYEFTIRVVLTEHGDGTDAQRACDLAVDAASDVKYVEAVEVTDFTNMGWQS